MQRVLISSESYALIAARAARTSSRLSPHSAVQTPDGVGVLFSEAVIAHLAHLSPDPDLALRKLLLGERMAVH